MKRGVLRGCLKVAYGPRGESMPQGRSRRRKAGRLIVERAKPERAKPERAKALRAIAGASLLVLLVGFSTSAARAADDDGTQSPFSKFMRSLGLKRAPDADASINYNERAPLVVPPTRDLPPPVTSVAVPAPDWPKDSARRHRNDKSKPGIVPGTAVQTPNPPYQKKPWYNPAGWFDKEEYANFAGEPVRQHLTDPPAGYLIPSPNEPYGIPSDKDKGKTHASAKDLGMGSLTPPPSGGSGQ